MIKLKTHQLEFARNWIKNKRRGLMKWCKDAGKTTTITEMVCNELLCNTYRVVNILDYNTELFNRIKDELGDDIDYVADNVLYVHTGSVVILTKYPIKADLLVIDDLNWIKEDLMSSIITCLRCNVFMNFIGASGVGPLDNISKIKNNYNINVFCDHFVIDNAYTYFSKLYKEETQNSGWCHHDSYLIDKYGEAYKVLYKNKEYPIKSNFVISKDFILRNCKTIEDYNNLEIEHRTYQVLQFDKVNKNGRQYSKDLFKDINYDLEDRPMFLINGPVKDYNIRLDHVSGRVNDIEVNEDKNTLDTSITLFDNKNGKIALDCIKMGNKIVTNGIGEVEGNEVKNYELTSVSLVAQTPWE